MNEIERRFKRSIILAFTIISLFIFLISVATMYAQTEIISGNACYCTFPIPLLIPTFASLGLFTGLLTYYLLFPKVKKDDKKILEIVKNLLNEEERTVFEMVIKEKEITQAKVSRILGKVKAFRVIESLKRKGLITKEKIGKTSKIKLKITSS